MLPGTLAAAAATASGQSVPRGLGGLRAFERRNSERVSSVFGELGDELRGHFFELQPSFVCLPMCVELCGEECVGVDEVLALCGVVGWVGGV